MSGQSKRPPVSLVVFLVASVVQGTQGMQYEYGPAVFPARAMDTGGWRGHAHAVPLAVVAQTGHHPGACPFDAEPRHPSCPRRPEATTVPAGQPSSPHTPPSHMQPAWNLLIRPKELPRAEAGFGRMQDRRRKAAGGVEGASSDPAPAREWDPASKVPVSLRPFMYPTKSRSFRELPHVSIIEEKLNALHVEPEIVPVGQGRELRLRWTEEQPKNKRPPSVPLVVHSFQPSASFQGHDHFNYHQLVHGLLAQRMEPGEKREQIEELLRQREEKRRAMRRNYVRERYHTDDQYRESLKEHMKKYRASIRGNVPVRQKALAKRKQSKARLIDSDVYRAKSRMYGENFRKKLRADPERAQKRKEYMKRYNEQRYVRRPSRPGGTQGGPPTTQGEPPTSAPE